VRRQSPPKEDPAIGAFRERQIRDLAELDEEENRRIKSALFPRNRIFRRRSGDASVRVGAGKTGRAANISSSSRRMK